MNHEKRAELLGLQYSYITNGLDIRVWLSLSMCRMRVYACYEVGVGIGRGAC